MLLPHGSQVTKISAQNIALFRSKCIMLNDVFHIINRRVEFIFIEMTPRHLAIEVRKMPLRVFVPFDFFSSMTFIFRRPPQIILRAIDESAPVLPKPPFTLVLLCRGQNGETAENRCRCHYEF